MTQFKLIDPKQLSSDPDIWAAILKDQGHLIVELDFGDLNEEVTLDRSDITLRASKSFELTVNGNSREFKGVLITLPRKQEASVVHSFWDLVAYAISKNQITKFEDLVLLIQELEKVFNAPKPTHESLIGLWGELLAINTSRDPVAVAKSWISTIRSTVDFKEGNQSAEVKCSSSKPHLHNFDLTQLEVPNNEERCIVSIYATDEPPLTSVKGLMAKIEEDLKDHPGVLLSVKETYLKKLRLRTDLADSVGFNLRDSADQKRILNAREIPRPIVPNTFEGLVRDIKFSADVGSISDWHTPPSCGLIHSIS